MLTVWDVVINGESPLLTSPNFILKGPYRLDKTRCSYGQHIQWKAKNAFLAQASLAQAICRTLCCLCSRRKLLQCCVSFCILVRSLMERQGWSTKPISEGCVRTRGPRPKSEVWPRANLFKVVRMFIKDGGGILSARIRARCPVSRFLWQHRAKEGTQKQ